MVEPWWLSVSITESTLTTEHTEVSLMIFLGDLGDLGG